MVNKKYYQLDNKAWLKQERKTKTCTEIAEQIGSFRQSVAYACRVFSKEESAQFRVARVHASKDTI